MTLSAVWSSDIAGCNSTVGQGTLDVSVALQEPTSVVLTVSAPALAHTGDPAARVGSVVTTATVSVVLRYPGGVTRDVSTDPRLRIEAVVAGGGSGANVSSLVVVDRVAGTAGAFRVQAAAGVSGVATLRATFSQFTESFSRSLAGNGINVSVVRFVSATLQTSPHPVFPGSQGVNKTEMHLFSASSVRQGLVARLSVSLSDGTTHDVSTSAHASLLAFLPGDTLPSTSVVAVSRASNGFVVNARGEGSADLVASFGGTNNIASLRVRVTSQRAHVTRLIASFPDTLRGVANQTTAQIAVAAEFDDGTQLTSMFDNTGEHLLLCFHFFAKCKRSYPCESFSSLLC